MYWRSTLHVYVLLFSEYVGELYNTLISTPREKLKAIEKELNDEIPEPLHSMLEKEDKSDAIKKYKARKTKETIIVPPTCTGNVDRHKHCFC